MARDLMKKDRTLRAELIRAFGNEAYQSDGTLNRPYLAEKIFASTRLRKRMNAIVHPFVFQAIDRVIESEYADQSEAYVLIEAALIFESGMDKTLDAVLLVDAPVDARVDRISRRDGLSGDQIRKRIQSQESAQAMRKKADFILDNIGDITEIRPKVCFLDSIFRQI
jgi:dephospho-CoA kinase